jgi:hypothetical protein
VARARLGERRGSAGVDCPSTCRLDSGDWSELRRDLECVDLRSCMRQSHVDVVDSERACDTLWRTRCRAARANMVYAVTRVLNNLRKTDGLQRKENNRGARAVVKVDGNGRHVKMSKSRKNTRRGPVRGPLPQFVPDDFGGRTCQLRNLVNMMTSTMHWSAKVNARDV